MVTFTRLAECIRGPWRNVKVIRIIGTPDNGIDVEGATQLSKVLGKMTELQTLDLSGNRIGVGGATALSQVLSTMKGLQTLDLSDNGIGVEGATQLSKVLGEMTELQTLDLSGNGIDLKGATELSKVLGKMTGLKTLNLYSNKIGGKGATKLSEALGNMAGLQTLHLGGNGIGDEGATELSKVLGKMKGLQTLNLYNCRIGVGGATELSQVLRTMTGLQTLDLGSNRIGVGGATELSQVLSTMTGLQTLDLGRNGIGVEGATKLSEVLGNMKGLQTLDLYYNGIGDEGATKLSEVLGKMEGLQTLNLGDNGIGDEGATKLSEVLGKMTGLQTLNLYSNRIGVEGATKLSEALGNMTGLKTLNLRNNKIGVEGATKLSKVLGKMTGLQTLNLGKNGIGDEGATKLSEVLGKMTGLQTLNLGKNGIGDEGATKLSQVLSTMTGLQTLKLSGNEIGNTASQLVTDALKKKAEAAEKIRDNDYACRMAAENGDIEAIQYLHKEVGLTVDDFRSDNNYACRMAAQNGHIEVIKYLHKEVGLTASDFRTDDNYACRAADKYGHIEVGKYLRDSGLAENVSCDDDYSEYNDESSDESSDPPAIAKSPRKRKRPIPKISPNSPKRIKVKPVGEHIKVTNVEFNDQLHNSSSEQPDSGDESLDETNDESNNEIIDKPEGDDLLSKFRRGEVEPDQLSECHPNQSEHARTVSRIIFDMILDKDNRVKEEIMRNRPLFSEIKLKLIVLVPQMSSLYNQTCLSVPQELRERCGGTAFVCKRDDICKVVVHERSKCTLTLLIHDECHHSHKPKQIIPDTLYGTVAGHVSEVIKNTHGEYTAEAKKRDEVTGKLVPGKGLDFSEAYDPLNPLRKATIHNAMLIEVDKLLVDGDFDESECAEFDGKKYRRRPGGGPFRVAYKEKSVVTLPLVYLFRGKGLLDTNSFTIAVSATPNDHIAVHNSCGNRRGVIPLRPNGYIGFKTLLDARQIVSWSLEPGPMTDAAGNEQGGSKIDILVQQYISAFDNQQKEGQGGDGPIQRVVNELCYEPPVPLLIRLPAAKDKTKNSNLKFKEAMEGAIRRNKLRISIKLHTHDAGTAGEGFGQYENKAVIVIVNNKGGIGDRFPKFNYDLRGVPLKSDEALVQVVGRVCGFTKTTVEGRPEPRRRGTVIVTDAMLKRLKRNGLESSIVKGRICIAKHYGRRLSPEEDNYHNQQHVKGKRIVLCAPCQSGKTGTYMSIAYTMLKYCLGFVKLPPTTGMFDWKMGPMWCKYGFAVVDSKPTEYTLDHLCIKSGLSETGNIYVQPRPDVATETSNTDEPEAKRARIDPSMRKAVEESSLVGFSFYLPEGTTDVRSLWKDGPPYPLCIPSFMRSSVITLDGYECDTESTRSRSVFIVLHRHDPDMQGYLHKHPNHCIVILPEGDGLGFARLMIQTMGETFNAGKIWMLDDNIESWQSHVKNAGPNQCKKSKLSTVLSDVERAIEREEYDIGVLGFPKSNNVCDGNLELWPRKHVYAAVLLNIEGLRESQVKYNKNHKRFEDVCFNIAVESYNLTASRKLPVVQCPWYSFQKRHTKAGGCSQLFVGFSAENVAVALSARRLVAPTNKPMNIYNTLAETIKCGFVEFFLWQRSAADNGTDVYSLEWAMLQYFLQSPAQTRRPFIFIPQEETKITAGMRCILQGLGIKASPIHHGKERELYFMTPI